MFTQMGRALKRPTTSKTLFVVEHFSARYPRQAKDQPPSTEPRVRSPSPASSAEGNRSPMTSVRAQETGAQASYDGQRGLPFPLQNGDLPIHHHHIRPVGFDPVDGAFEDGVDMAGVVGDRG